MDGIVLNILLVATNLFYILPALAAWRRRMHSLMPWFVAVLIFSSIHHGCFDASFCLLDLTAMQFSTVDVLLSTQTSILIFLVPTNYDLIKMTAPPHEERRVARRHPSIRLVKHLAASYVLVEHTYGRVFEAAVTIVTIVTSIFLPGTIWAMVAPLILAVPIVLGTILVYLPMKRSTSKMRIHVPLAAAAGVVGVSGVVLFALEEAGVLGRYVHPIWHALTAIASWLWILAVTKHLRVDSLSETLLFCRKPPHNAGSP